MAKLKVLFLCTGNSARSQMAEAFLRKHGSDHFEAYSAGLEPRGIHPMTQTVLEEAGIDLSVHRSKSIREYLGYERFDYIITVCRRTDDNCPKVYPEARSYQRWVFDDPVRHDGSEDDKLENFRATRDRMEARVKLWLEETLEQLGATTPA
ncbi:MAG: arsenate reductase ArsC [Chloroflexota bacterium]|nr:arsenate reductase ArsC [Chloroflexota bacterium]